MSADPIARRIARRARRTCRSGAKATVQCCRHALRGGRPHLHVFVAGAQRSGTNMVMDVLDRSLDTTVFHERDERAFDNYLMREPEVIDELVERARGRVFVIKALCEADRLPFLTKRFAPAATLWVFRHYEAAVRSSLHSFTKVAGQVSDLVDDPLAHGWMGRGMSSNTHARIRDLHHPGMNDASRVALFWYIRNRMLHDTGLAGDPRVRLVHYERLLEAPNQELGRLFEWLGLTYRPAIGADVRPQARHGSESLPIESEVRAACDELSAELEQLAADGVVGGTGSDRR